MTDALAPQSSLRLPKAVLWDLDGTIIDSEPQWMDAEARLASEHGVEWTTERSLQLVGCALPDGAQALIDWGVRLSVDEIIARFEAVVIPQLEAHMPWQPGARELLVALRDAGVPCALVTMSTRSIVEPVVRALEAEVGPGTFAATVAGDEVARGKPHPDPYLRGLELLGLSARDARDCVAIEDSPTGASAALAAGLTTIGVPHAVDISAMPGLVHWASLEGRTVADLRALFDSEEHA